MLNDHEKVARNEFNISGHYLGCNSAFASGTAYLDRESYDRTLEHLKSVLTNATPTGNPHWGNEGICVSAWLHGGKPVINKSDLPIDFHTLESFEQKLAELNAVPETRQGPEH